MPETDPQLAEADDLVVQIRETHDRQVELQQRALTLAHALQERADKLIDACGTPVAPPPSPAPEPPKKAAPGEVQAAVLTFLVDHPCLDYRAVELADVLGLKAKSVAAALRALTKREAITEGKPGAFLAEKPTPEAAAS